MSDGHALQASVAEHRPDAAIVDVRMPPAYTDEGLRAAIAIRRDHPGVGILVFSQYVEKHINNILAKLGLPPSDADQRRLLAVLPYLRS